jgi:hypothetical protein
MNRLNKRVLLRVRTACTKAKPHRLAWPAALALASVVLSGCAGDRVAYSPAAVAVFSPMAEVVGPLEVYPLARRYVEEHPGTDYRVGSGDSMRALYRDHTVIITSRMPISGLRPGMTVVFVGDGGFPVAHVLVRKTSEGWIAMGVSNPSCDSRRVGADNYEAVVVRAFEPSSSPMLALTEDPVTRSAGPAIVSNP